MARLDAYGGSNSQAGNGIALGPNEDVYITGFTSSALFPTKNPKQSNLNGSQDAVVCQFDTNLSFANSLIYSTYLGGNGSDNGRAICIDAMGNFYVTGSTTSTNFPLSDCPYQSLKTDTSTSAAFITKYNPDGSEYLFSSYFGGNAPTTGFQGTIATSIACEGQSVVICGRTDSPSLPLLEPYPTTAPSAASFTQGFIARFDTTLCSQSSLIYSSYFGGSDPTFGTFLNGIAITDRGNIYITGQTSSGSLPTLNGYQTMIAGNPCAFISELFFPPPPPPAPPPSSVCPVLKATVINHVPSIQRPFQVDLFYELVWSAPQDFIPIIYNIYRNQELIGSVSPTVFSFTNHYLKSSAYYHYQVIGVDSNGSEKVITEFQVNTQKI